MGKTRDRPAKEAGSSGRTPDKVEYLEEHATEEINQKADSGEMSVDRIRFSSRTSGALAAYAIYRRRK